MRVETEFASALASHQRVMLWITSSALKVSPFDQVMPWRTFKVSVLASSLASQPSSSHGSKVKSRFQRTRYSLHWRAMLDISTPSKVRGSRNALMFMATRRMPPFFGDRRLGLAGGQAAERQGAGGADAERGHGGEELAPAGAPLLEVMRDGFGHRMQGSIGEHHLGHGCLLV